MNPENLTVGLAFIAGLISFISPCVLPLVPAYIGYMGGRVTNTVAAQMATAGNGQVVLRPTVASRFNTALHGLFFVAGFTFVFVTIGLLITAFVQQVGGQNITLVTGIIGRIGGVFIIGFGLHFMGVLPAVFKKLLTDSRIIGHPGFTPAVALLGTAFILWGLTGTLLPSLVATRQTTAGSVTFTHWPTVLAFIVSAIYLLWLFLGGAFTNPRPFWTNVIASIQTALYSDTRRQVAAQGEQSYASSAIMGVIFAAGWTPCIGPVYGAVLTMAANTAEIGRAGVLLAVYSIGLGVPFIITALLLDSAQGILRQMQRRMHTIKLVSGAFLILIGILVATGTLQNLSQWLSSGQVAEAAIQFEENIVNSIIGEPDAAIQPTAVTPPLQTSGALGSITDAAANTTAPVTGTSINDAAPNFETVTDTGETIRLSDLKGQVVVLNFWGTWCIPCKEEMPEFEKAYQENADRGFTILAVNNRDTVEAVQNYRQEMGLSFPLLMDVDEIIRKSYGIVSFPSTFVLDRDGKIIARHFGALTAEDIEQLVSQALAA